LTFNSGRKVMLLVKDNMMNMPCQATSDKELIELWLHGHSQNTKLAYKADIKRWLDFVQKPLFQITLGDIQQFSESLIELAPATQGRILAAIKSLLAFGNRIGYLQHDVGRPIILPPRKNTLSERILSESDVHRLITVERSQPHSSPVALFFWT